MLFSSALLVFFPKKGTHTQTFPEALKLLMVGKTSEDTFMCRI